MKTLKKIYLEAEHNTTAPSSNPDSMWSRITSKKGGNGGAAIQKKLGIEDEGHESVFNKQPLSIMDIVNQIWDGEHLKKALEDEEEDGEK